MASPLSGRILVTGGAGFIGSALVWALNQRGHTDIVVTDVLGTDEKWKNLVPLKFEDYVDAADFRSRLAANRGVLASNGRVHDMVLAALAEAEGDDVGSLPPPTV